MMSELLMFVVSASVSLLELLIFRVFWFISIMACLCFLRFTFEAFDFIAIRCHFIVSCLYFQSDLALAVGMDFWLVSDCYFFLAR